MMAFIRSLLYILLGIFDQLVGRKNQLFVLCYHSVSDDGWRYGISLKELEKQIIYLKRQYDIIDVELFFDYLLGKKKLTKQSVLITFDDGYQDVSSTIALFSHYNIKPVMFVIGDTSLANRAQLQTERPLLSPSEIRLLIKNGWTIGDHSMTHADFSELKNEEIVKKEVLSSKKKIEKTVGIPVAYFAYPKGVYNNEILSAVEKAGFRGGFSMDDQLISGNTNVFAIPRVGVDRSHTFGEFIYLASPSVLIVRRILRKVLGGLL